MSETLQAVCEDMQTYNSNSPHLITLSTAALLLSVNKMAGILQLRSALAPALGRCRMNRRRLQLVACVTYNFADSGNEDTGRMNRTIEKRKAKELDKIVAGLTHMTNKQLQAVSHLLQPKIPSIMHDISIAAKLPRSNQGRKRQEDLIAKKIRETIDEDAMAKLAAAVALAEDTQALYEDSDIQNLLESWKEQLLAGEQGVYQELLVKAKGFGIDLTRQQLSQLVRQLQTCISEEQQEVAAVSAAAVAAATSSQDSGSDEEGAGSSSPSTSPSTSAPSGSKTSDKTELASLLAELGPLSPRKRRGGKRSSGQAVKSSENDSVRVKRQARQLAENALNKVLKRLAERQVLQV